MSKCRQASLKSCYQRLPAGASEKSTAPTPSKKIPACPNPVARGPAILLRKRSRANHRTSNMNHPEEDPSAISASQQRCRTARADLLESMLPKLPLPQACAIHQCHLGVTPLSYSPTHRPVQDDAAPRAQRPRIARTFLRLHPLPNELAQRNRLHVQSPPQQSKVLWRRHDLAQKEPVGVSCQAIAPTHPPRIYAGPHALLPAGPHDSLSEEVHHAQIATTLHSKAPDRSTTTYHHQQHAQDRPAESPAVSRPHDPKLSAVRPLQELRLSSTHLHHKNHTF